MRAPRSPQRFSRGGCPHMSTLTSGVALFLPDFPIGADGLEHGFGGVVQPLRFLLVEMAEDEFAGGWSAEMDVGGFPSHGVEQAKFGVGGAQGCEFDAGAVRAEAANDPASAQLDERIGTADGAVDDGLVEDFGGAVVALEPRRSEPSARMKGPALWLRGRCGRRASRQWLRSGRGRGCRVRRCGGRGDTGCRARALDARWHRWR